MKIAYDQGVDILRIVLSDAGIEERYLQKECK